MTGRTLEEMYSGYVHALLLSEDDEVRYCAQNFKGLLAIAQGQREEVARLKANASTAAFDKVNDQLREANAENEKLRKQIADDNEMAKKTYGY